jgi:hypothetical protein
MDCQAHTPTTIAAATPVKPRGVITCVPKSPAIASAQKTANYWRKSNNIVIVKNDVLFLDYDRHVSKR